METSVCARSRKWGFLVVTSVQGLTGCYLDYSSIQKPHLSGGMVAHAFKPSTWKPEAGKSM